MPDRRTIHVKALSRVEGEGALYVKLDGERVEHVGLNIYEPPRFFEAFLRGRAVQEVPDITARICGICPAYHRECFGCYGPKEQPNLISLTAQYRERGVSREHLVRLSRNFNGYAPEFREASEALEANTPAGAR